MTAAALCAQPLAAAPPAPLVASTFDADVVLSGGGVTLPYGGRKKPSRTKWTHFVVKLSGKKRWTDGSTGLKATPEQMEAVLASLDTLLVRGEFLNGPETFDLDNVALRPPAR